MIGSDCTMGNEHIAACPDDPALFLMPISQRVHISDIYQDPLYFLSSGAAF